MRVFDKASAVVLVLIVLAGTQITGCAAGTAVAAAGSAMVGIVQLNEVLAPFFEAIGL